MGSSMKTLILILLTSTLFAGHTLLISGLSKHGEKQDRFGEAFNSVHYGLGYKYSTNEVEQDTYDTITVMAFKDSYKNNMYTLTYGVHYKLSEGEIKSSIGLEGGIAYKNVKTEKNYNISFNYEPIPVFFIPSFTIEVDRLSLNFIYVPHFENDGAVVDEVLYMNVGISF